MIKYKYCDQHPIEVVEEIDDSYEPPYRIGVICQQCLKNRVYSLRDEKSLESFLKGIHNLWQ